MMPYLMMQKAMEKQALPTLRHLLDWEEEEKNVTGRKKGISDDFEYCEACGIFHYKECHVIIKDNRGKESKRWNIQSIP